MSGCPVCPNCAGGFPKTAPPSVRLQKEGDPVYKAEKRLYLTEDRSRVVEEGDPAAAFLLVSEGGEIQDEEAVRLGLTGKAKEPEPIVVHSTAADPPKADEAPAEAKMVESPPENKAARSAARKADEDK